MNKQNILSQLDLFNAQETKKAEIETIKNLKKSPIKVMDVPWKDVEASKKYLGIRMKDKRRNLVKI